MRDHTPAIETVAALSERLAVLLSAGVSPVAAWGYLDLGDDETARRVIAAAAEAAARGGNVGAAIARTVTADARLLDPGRAGVRRNTRQRASQPGAWLALGAAWQVATNAGAPLAPSLRDFAAAFRQLGEIERERALALAAPAATARMVLALPAIGVLFGSLLGFNTLHTLFATLAGWICIALAGAMLAAAWAWSRALVRRAEPLDTTPGLFLELMAIGMEGGGSIERARSVVDAATRKVAGDRAAERVRIEEVLELSARAGVPAAELLRSEAKTVRRVADAAGRRKAMELSVALMLPLGLCVLPSFLMVGVVPLLITVIGSTIGTF